MTQYSGQGMMNRTDFSVRRKTPVSASMASLGTDDVDALGGQDLQTAGVGGQVLDVLGPHACGVDGAPGPDLVGGAGVRS